MIKRREKQFFSTRSWKYTFPKKKKNQRTQKLIERPLILGITWNWNKVRRYSPVLFLNFPASRYAFFFFFCSRNQVYMLSLMNEVDPYVAFAVGFCMRCKTSFSNT